MADNSGDTSCETTMEYWDCECDEDFTYINPKKNMKCPRCGAERDESPDARINEVKTAGLPLGDINTVFTSKEIDVILDAAILAFAHSDMFGQIAEDAKISDDYMIEIRERLQNFIDKV
jgi:hypothetical protein